MFISATCPTVEPEYAAEQEPTRSLCVTCEEPVLVVVARVLGVVVAEPFEWEPRARCYVCSQVQSRIRDCPKCKGSGVYREDTCPRCSGAGEVVNQRTNCNRCGGAGFVGSQRPDEPMLAIDIAWGDEDHIRVIGPNTTRKRGEALYRMHTCADNSVIIADRTQRKAVAA